MSDIKLSPVNTKLIQNGKNNAVSQVIDNKPVETDKKSQNKKTVCTIAAALGAAALAAVYS